MLQWDWFSTARLTRFHRAPRRRTGSVEVERLEDRALLSSITWATSLGGSGRDVPAAITATSDGGYAVVGTTDSFEGQHSDIWLIRFGPDGALLWSRTYGGGLFAQLGGPPHAPDAQFGTFSNDTATDIVALANGSVVITGRSAVSSGTDSDGISLIIDASGGLLEATWQASGDHSNSGVSLIHNGDWVSVAQSGNNPVFGGNVTLNTITHQQSLEIFGSTTFININGNYYAGTLPHGGLDLANRRLSQLTTTYNDGLAIVGERDDGTYRQTYVAFQPAGGGSLKGVSLTNGTNEIGTAIAATPFDPAHPSLPQYLGVTSVTMPFSAGEAVTPIVRKLNAITMLPVWEVTLPLGPGERPTSIVATPDGGFVVALNSMLSSHAGVASGSNAVLVKLDADGHLVWAKAYGGRFTEGDSSDAQRVDLIATADGYALTVSTSSFGADDEESASLNYWVVKTDLEGNIPLMSGIIRDITAQYTVAPFSTNIEPTDLDTLTPLANFAGYLSTNQIEIRGQSPISLGDVNDVVSTTVGAEQLLQSTLAYDAGAVQLIQTSYFAEEGGYVDVIVNRTDAMHGAYGIARVNFTVTKNGTTSDADFHVDPPSGVLEFADGEMSKSIRVFASPDTEIYDPGESLTLTLQDLDLRNDYALGALITTTINLENSTPAPGRVQFSSATYEVNENQSYVNLTVTRTNGLATPFQVDYATRAAQSGWQATVGDDYTATSGTLYFDANVTSRTIQIAIQDNDVVEADEGFEVRLSLPTNGAELGSITTALVVIHDTEQPVRPTILKFERLNPADANSSAATLVFRATFSTPLNSVTVDAADFAVAGGATASVTAASPVAGTNGTAYDLTVAGGNLATFVGSVSLNLKSTANIADLMGNLILIGEPPIDQAYNHTVVTNPNRAPSFTKGADVAIVENAGPFTVVEWATGISAGAGDTGQVVNFLVTTNNDALFSELPAIASNGTLTFTTAPNVHGTAIVTVRAHDDGGTSNGTDTSAPQTFTVTVRPANHTGAAELQIEGTPVIWVNNKKQPTKANVLSLITVSGDHLAGGTLTVTINAAVNTKKRTLIDSLTIPPTSSLGTSQTPQIVNNLLTFQLQLNHSATAAQLQAFLRGISFSTSGKGLLQKSRTVNVTLIDADAHRSSITKTITVLKKLPRK